MSEHPNIGVGSGGAALLKGLLGASSFVEQIFLWTVLGEVITALLGPFLVTAAGDVNARNPLVPHTPPDLADQVVRGILDHDSAAAEAARSGEDGDRFQRRVYGAGEPPGLEMVLQWWRRGFVGWDDTGPGVPSVERAIKTSRTYTYWTDVIRNAQWLPLPVGEAVNAWVRQQIPAERAREYLRANGIAEAEADVLYHTTGRPPAPGELAQFVRRGLIPLTGTGPDALSMQQGILEGDLKDKWEPIFRNLVVAYPSVLELHRMQQAGAIDTATAARYYAIHGIPADLVAALAESGSSAKVAKARELTEAQVIKLYDVHLIDHAQASTMLEALRYTPEETAELLSLADLNHEIAALDAAVARVHALYRAHKLSGAEVATALAQYEVPNPTAEHLLTIWQHERAREVKVLTPSEVTRAWKAGIMERDAAEADLQALGYSAFDAWVLLSLAHGEALDNPPAAGGHIEDAAL